MECHSKNLLMLPFVLVVLTMGNYFQVTNAAVVHSIGMDLASLETGMIKSASQHISYGQEAEKDQFPWMVGIYLNGENAGFCGGILISPKAVLTAAHCLEGRDEESNMEADILVGAYHNNFNDCDCDIRGVKDYRTANYTFSEKLISGDLAVIFLDKPSSRPYARLTTRFPSSNDIGRVMGWGYTETSTSSLAINLRFTDVEILDKSECPYEFYDAESTICTKSYIDKLPDGATSTSCKGDSGGPLMVPDTDEILGIVSYAVSTSADTAGCGTWERVGFSSVAYHLPWLKSIGIDVDIAPYRPPCEEEPCPIEDDITATPSCPSYLEGTYMLESIECPGEYIAYAKSCSNNDVNLRTENQAKADRTHWLINTTIGEYSNIETAGRNCRRTILASNRDISLGSGRSMWQYNISHPEKDCNIVNLQAKGGQGKGKYLGVRSDCKDFYFRKYDSNLSRWRLVNIDDD